MILNWVSFYWHFSSISSLNTMVLVVCLRFFWYVESHFSFSFEEAFSGMQSELILNLFVLYPMFSSGSIVLNSILDKIFLGLWGLKAKLVYKVIIL